MGNPLLTLLDLPDQERVDRGLEHTPREIWQQPDTWGTTFRICSTRKTELNDFLRRAGIPLRKRMARPARGTNQRPARGSSLPLEAMANSP